MDFDSENVVCAGIANRLQRRQNLPLRMKFMQRRWLIATASALVAVALVGFFILPPIVRSQGEQRLSQALGRDVTIGRVRLNPFALSATIEDFAIKEKDSAATFLGWRSLYVRFDLTRSIFGEWVVGAVRLDGFRAAVTVNPDGSFNFSDLLTKVAAAAPAAKTPSAPSRPVLVGSLAVSDAAVSFADLSLKHPLRSQVGPVTFLLSGFRTVGSAGAPYHFEATTDAGEVLRWSGSVAADPVSSDGQFAIENLVLGKYAPYFEDRVGADIRDGRLSLSGAYRISLDPKQRVIALDQGAAHLRSLALVERANGQELVLLPSVDV
jgi:uncharacterized protein involved in outer membrane biogenesis